MALGNLKFFILTIVFLVVVIALPKLGVRSGLQVPTQGGCFGGFLCRDIAFNLTYQSISFAMSQNFSSAIYDVHLSCVGPNVSGVNVTPSWRALAPNGVLEPPNSSGIAITAGSFADVVNLRCNGNTPNPNFSCFFGKVSVNFTLESGPPNSGNPWLSREAADIGGCANTESTTRTGTQLSFLTICAWLVMAFAFEVGSYVKKRRGGGPSAGTAAFLSVSLTFVAAILSTGFYETLLLQPGELFNSLISPTLGIINQAVSMVLALAAVFLCVRNRWLAGGVKASRIVFLVPVALFIISFFTSQPLINSLDFITRSGLSFLLTSSAGTYNIVPVILSYSFLLYLPLIGSLLLGFSIRRDDRTFKMLVLESLFPLFLAFLAGFVGPVSWSLNYISYIGFASLPILLFMVAFALKGPEVLTNNKSRRRFAEIFVVALLLTIVLLFLFMPMSMGA